MARADHMTKAKLTLALAGVAQWTECWPAKWKSCWFNSQSGHMPGAQARSSAVDVQEATNRAHRRFSPSFSPSFLLSLKINKNKNPKLTELDFWPVR